MNRILAVDDDGSVLRLLAAALADYDLTVTRNASEAWLAARRGKPDLLITDYMMPCAFGDELIARLRRLWPDLKVLVLSGHCEILDREGLAWWNSEAHLAKPFRVGTLRAKVSELIAAESWGRCR